MPQDQLTRIAAVAEQLSNVSPKGAREMGIYGVFLGAISFRSPWIRILNRSESIFVSR